MRPPAGFNRYARYGCISSFHALLKSIPQHLAKPEVSKFYKEQPAVQQWLVQNRRFFFILGAILAVTHPEQYSVGIAMLMKLKDNADLLRQPEHMETVLKTWLVPFSGVSVICNRETQVHIDRGGAHCWYDILANMGTHPAIPFSIPGICARLTYRPGTVVALCGRLLAHQVPPTSGDRVCYAWYMRDTVRSYLDFPNPSPSTPTTLHQSFPHLPL
jgi:hypothetical protein